MPFGIRYHPDVKKVDLSRIDKRSRSRIRTAIEERLANQPEVYGKPLRRTLKGYWKLRVGDYNNAPEETERYLRPRRYLSRSL